MPKKTKSYKHLIQKKSALPDRSAPLSGFDCSVGSDAPGPQEQVAGGGGDEATTNAADVPKRRESGGKTEAESTGKVAKEPSSAAPIIKPSSLTAVSTGNADSAQSSPSSVADHTGVSPSSVTKSTDSSSADTPPDVPKSKQPVGERREEAGTADSQPRIHDPNQGCDESSVGAGRTSPRQMAKQVDRGAMTVVQKGRMASKVAEDATSSTGHAEGAVLTKAGKHRVALERDGQVRTFIEMPKELRHAIAKHQSFGGTFRMAVCVALYKQFLPGKLDEFLGGGGDCKTGE